MVKICFFSLLLSFSFPNTLIRPVVYLTAMMMLLKYIVRMTIDTRQAQANEEKGNEE
jgi:hypothetical protein